MVWSLGRPLQMTQQRRLQHLFLRAGFGETPAAIEAMKQSSLADITAQLFENSLRFTDIRYLPYPLNESQEKKGVTPFLFVKMLLKSRKEMEELNAEWLFKMANTQAVVREKLTFFWHNHFATSVPFAWLMQEQNNTLRRLALDHFGMLLHAVAKDPAMLLYLNNQENRKDHPNENFAREVMELFTLGIGHYTEQDIREAARAFTGWSVNAHGEFEFRAALHDDGEKVFLGRKGNFGGEDILNILLEEKQTSRFLVTKLYREYVNPVVPPDRLEELADAYYATGYDTRELLRTIFSASWFYDEENMGAKIASPVELIVRYKKLVGLDFPKTATLLNLQRALGQVLFFPPNVAGWKGGTAWIDSTSLLIRLGIPRTLLDGGDISLRAKPAFEESESRQQAGNVTADWSALTGVFRNLPGDNRSEAMMDSLIQCNRSSVRAAVVESGVDLKLFDPVLLEVVNVMSLPEFQLI